MTSDSEHTPSPAFRAHLAWEVRRAARREARFSAPVSPRGTRRLRLAGLVAACLALGVASNFASAQVSSSSRRDSLVEAVRAEIQVATLRAQLSREVLDQVNKQVALGVIRGQEAATARSDMSQMEARLRRLQADLAEVQVTALPPRNELTAPRVGDRDFVRERLESRMTDVTQRLALTERTLEEFQQRFRAGVVDDFMGIQEDLERVRAQAELTNLAERRKLREDFLEKRVSADEVMRRDEVSGIRADLSVAVRAMEMAGRRLALVERQQVAGAATRLELLRAQVEVEERRLEVDRLKAQADRLKTRGGN